MPYHAQAKPYTDISIELQARPPIERIYFLIGIVDTKAARGDVDHARLCAAEELISR
jgi:hypothetical protein